MIVPTKFYLGGSNSVSHSASSYYIFERGTTVYNGRSKNWTGKIGLMYPSDYAYTYANGVDNKCYTDTYYCCTSYNGNPSSGWLYNNDYHWTISPDSDVSYGLFLAYSDGNIGYIDISGEFDVRPSLYLSSDIQITEGNGSQESPYQLKIN